MGLLNGLASMAEPPRAIINMFSSHGWSQAHRREDMHSLLAPEWIYGRHFHDFSVTKDNPIVGCRTEAELFDVLSARIRICDVVTVFAGMEATHSTWMDREVCAARAHGVKVLAIIPHHQQKCSSIRDMADDEAHWYGGSIRSKILELIPPARAAAFEAHNAWRKNQANLAALAAALAPKNHLAELRFGPTILTEGLRSGPPSATSAANLGHTILTAGLSSAPRPLGPPARRPPTANDLASLITRTKKPGE